MNSIVNIFKSSSMFKTLDENNFLFRSIPPFEIPSDKARCFVSGFVINDDHSVVFIFLLKNRLQVPCISIVHLVVVGWSNNASMKLFLSIIDSINPLMIFPFPFINLFQKRIIFKISTSQHFVLQIIQKLLISDLFLRIYISIFTMILFLIFKINLLQILCSFFQLFFILFCQLFFVLF